jgi:single-stranded-DNA-specific exonuclease
VNLIGALEQCQPFLVRFGGHPMAAGLTVAVPQIAQFRQAFEAAVQQVLGAGSICASLEICGCLPFARISDTFLAELALLEPIGHGNPEPLFTAAGVSPERVFPVGKGHSRGVLADAQRARMDFIHFGTTPRDLPPPPWDIVYTPQINSFNGTESPQVLVHDIRARRPSP